MQDGIAELHPAFNMRRVPNKTTRFMKNYRGMVLLHLAFQYYSLLDATGIIHFAGTTHGNARTICIDPLQYPVLTSGAVPLYLTIVKRFFNSCPILSGFDEEWLSVKKTCEKAIVTMLKKQQSGTFDIDYVPGSSSFNCKIVDLFEHNRDKCCVLFIIVYRAA